MAYPMTYLRVIERNSLGDGDYDKVPSIHTANVNTNVEMILENPDSTKMIVPLLVGRVNQYESTMRLLAGDLRRLERDVVDENNICTVIAVRTNVDPDTVAAVLKEFINY